MATQVPYSGVPDVAPQLDPLPNVHVDTPVAAFGGATAGALTHMGEVAEGSGKELFARAYAMQEMSEQIKADNASTDTIEKQNGAYMELMNKEGPEREAAMPGYMEKLRQIREDGAKDLSSPFAQQQYNTFTRRGEATMIFHGAVGALEAHKQALTLAGANQVDAIGNQLALMDPANKESYEHGLVSIKTAAAQTVYDTKGFAIGSKENEDEVGKMLSKQILKSVSAVNKDHPEKASQLLDDMTKRGLLHPMDAAEIAPRVEYKLDTKYSEGTGLQVAKGVAGWDDYVAPDKLAQPALARGSMTTGTYGSISQPLQDGTHQVGKYGVNSKLLGERLGDLKLTDEQGKTVTTEEQFLNSAKAQEDFRKTVFPDIQKSAGSFKSALKDWYGADDPQHSAAAMETMAKNADPQEVSGRASKLAAAAVPNKPLVIDNAGDHAIRVQSIQKQQQFLADKDAEHTVIQMIDGTNSQDGRVPVSLDEARKDPKFAESFDKLGPESQSAVKKIINDNNRIGGVRPTQANELLFTKLKEIALTRDLGPDGSSPKDLEEFANTNLLTLPLTKDQRNQLVTMQHDVIKNQIANPNTTHALQIPAVDNLLKNVGIDKKSNPEEYAKFVGAYHDAIQAYGMGAERSIKGDDELTMIANGLVKKQLMGRFWGLGQQPYMGITKTSPQVLKLGQREFYAAHQRQPNPDGTDDDEVDKLALRQIFRGYGAQSGKASSGPKIGTRADQ